jgi:hypothetical protein
LNDDGASALAALVDPGPVERALFGTCDRDRIAAAIESAIEAALGERARGAIFYEASTGVVAGLELASGRQVVIKVQSIRPERLQALVVAQRALATRGFPCPMPLAPPFELGTGHARIEALIDRGERAQVHDPGVRREIAARLHEIGEVGETPPGLGASWFSGLAPDRVWPRPHHPRFDFEATRAGAEWIDSIAARARSVERSKRPRLGHFDWRSDHFRFEGERMVASFDWDSLHADDEAVIAGAGAASFAMRFEHGVPLEGPSLDDLDFFLADYQTARGPSFSRAERRTAEASCLYSLGYVTRCAHAIDAQGSIYERLAGVLRGAATRWSLGG